MSAFSREELGFLERHGFNEAQVHDGRLQGAEQRKRLAKEAGKILVLTNSPCSARGHRIRTRAGHCAQCDPKKISFVARETMFGYVYIAGSLKGRLIKIGSTRDVSNRERAIRSQTYGGWSDWSLLYSLRVGDAGRIEREVTNRLQRYVALGQYEKDGFLQTAQEMFRCSYSEAVLALNDVIELQNIDELLSDHPRYEFRR